MRNIFEKYDLQLFADGVSGEGAGRETSAGVTPAAAGQEADVTPAVAGQDEDSVTRALESLGVPKAEIEKYRAVKGIKAKAEPKAQATAEPVTAPAASDAQPVAAAGVTKAEENKRLSWDELMKDPEYSRKMSETVQASKKQQQAKLDAIAPMLELLGRSVGLDVSDLSKLDYAALNKAVVEKDSFYEEAALAAGQGVQDFKSQTRRELELNARERDIAGREGVFNNLMAALGKKSHSDKIASEAAALKQKFPAFDLEKEMQNPHFAEMVKPGGGLSVEQAYYALHHREIEQALVEQTAARASQALSKSVQAGRRVPAENGSQGRTNNPVGMRKYSELKTPEEKAAFEAMLKGGKLGNFV